MKLKEDSYQPAPFCSSILAFVMLVGLCSAPSVSGLVSPFIYVNYYTDQTTSWQIVPGEECYPGAGCTYTRWERNKYFYPCAAGEVYTVWPACQYMQCGQIYQDTFWQDACNLPQFTTGYRITETWDTNCNFVESYDTVGSMFSVEWVHCLTTNFNAVTNERCIWDGNQTPEHLTMIWTQRQSRIAQTTVYLNTGNLRTGDTNWVPPWDPSKPVPFRLKVQAWEQPGGALINPTNGFTVAGQPCDINGELFHRFLENQNVDVTPTLPARFTNYTFNLTIQPHKIVSLTRQYHPMFHSGSFTAPTLTELQTLCDEGAGILATDNDTKIADTDPSVVPSTNATSLYRSDDVPFYMEFQVRDGPTNFCTYTNVLLPVLPTNYAAAGFFDIVNDDDFLYPMINYGGANVKIVNSINTPLHPMAIAVTVFGTKNMTVRKSISATALIHEYGHACTLYHRNEMVGGQNANPGPATLGVMRVPDYWHNREINRAERGIIAIGP